jgi:hypothetical protein
VRSPTEFVIPHEVRDLHLAADCTGFEGSPVIFKRLSIRSGPEKQNREADGKSKRTTFATLATLAVDLG